MIKDTYGLKFYGPAGERIGCQLPRIHCTPPRVSSAGQECIELAASVGLDLDPWQRNHLADGLGETDELVEMRDGSTARRWASRDVAANVTRQAGKGGIIEARELGGVVLFGEKLIMHSAHEFKTANEAFLRIVGYFENYDWLRRLVKHIYRGVGEKTILLRDGARIKFVARKGGSGRGFSGDCNVLDEDMYLDAEQMGAMLPTLRAMPNPQLWYFGSAGLEFSTMLAALRRRALSADPGRLTYAEWSIDFESHARCDTCRLAEPGEELPPHVPYDRTDRELWWQASPSMGIRVTEEGMADELETLKEAPEEFDRELLGVGQYPAPPGEQWKAMTPEQWAALADPTSAAKNPVVLAFDVNPAQSRGSVAAAGDRPDGLVHFQLVDRRQGVAWIPGRLKELVEGNEVAAVVWVRRSPADAAVGQDVRDALADTGVQLVVLTGEEYEQACSMFLVGCTQTRRWRRREQPSLTTAMGAAAKEDRGKVWVWTNAAGSSVDITPAVAVTLATYGHVAGPKQGEMWSFFD